MVTFGFLAALLALAFFASAMIYAAVMDVLTMTVSDRLMVSLLVSFLILAPLSGWTAKDMGFSVVAAMMVFFASAAFFSLGWIGGGDGKIATVATIWLGAPHAFDFVIYTALFGGVCGLCLLLFRRLSLPSAWLRKTWVARLHATTTGIPYAVALGLAALFVLPGTQWVDRLAASLDDRQELAAHAPASDSMIAGWLELNQKES